MTAGLDLARGQILSFRRRVTALDERLPNSRRSVRRAAWAGLQDSMPRAALLSTHARVSGTRPDVLEDPSLVQVWGPRFSVFVVAAQDLAVFTLGRYPDDEKGRRRADQLADRLEAFLDGGRMSFAEAGRAMGEPPNRLRYAAPTGRVLLHWDGARRPEIWTVPAPDVDAGEARRELARRYLHIFGPATPEAFAGWAGVSKRRSPAVFEELRDELAPVRSPIGDAWILATDEAEFRAARGPDAVARLLPSGDSYFLLWGRQRELLVPDAEHRDALWTSRVWPGAVLVEGEIVGTWRRTKGIVTIQPWQRLSRAAHDAVEAEAAALPLPDVEEIVVRWHG